MPRCPADPRALLLATLALTSLAGGCAFAPGDAWGHLDLAVAVRFDPGSSRLTDEGWLKTSTSYAIEIEALTVRLDAVTVAMQGTGADASFDPAAPPPGYSLCDNGHCHADDGSLPTYEEVALALAGGTGGAQTVVDAAGAAVAATAGGAPVALGVCPGGCDLAPGVLHAVRVTVLEVGLEGRVRDLLSGEAARLPEGGVPILATWPALLTWSAPLDGVVGEGQPAAVNVQATVELPPQLFDGVDWGAHLVGGASFDTGALDDEVLDNLVEHGALTATLTRSPSAAVDPVAPGGVDEGLPEACEHMTAGPFTSVAAAPSLADPVHDATATHTRVGVVLTEVDGGLGGYVAFAAGDAGDHSFALSAEVPFTVLDAAAQEVPIEASTPVDVCDAVAVQHVVELEVGLHYLLLGPTDGPGEVGVVAEVGAPGEHTDHE